MTKPHTTFSTRRLSTMDESLIWLKVFSQALPPIRHRRNRAARRCGSISRESLLTAAIRRAMRPLDDHLNLRGRNRKRKHADAVDFDARDRRVQGALDKEVPGPFDASEQRLESLQSVIVGNGNPISGPAQEATGFRRCSQGTRTGSIKRSSRLVDTATRLVAKMTYSFAGARERIRCAEVRA